MDNKRETSSVVDELNRLDGQIDAAPDLNALKPIFYRLEEITKNNSADFDVLTRVSDIKQHLMSRGRQLKPEGGVTTGSNPILPAHASGTLGMAVSVTGAPPIPTVPTSSYPAEIDHTLPLPDPMRTASMETAAVRPESTREVFVPPVRTPPPPPPPAPPAGPPTNWKKPALFGGTLGLLLVIVIAGVMAYVKRKPAAPVAPPASTVAVSVATIPTGADIRVNDQPTCKSDCRINLKPGQYNLMAVLPGYEQALQAVTVEAGHPTTLSLTLVPQAPSLKILTDLGNGGQVFLDGKAMGPLQDGQIALDHLAAGTHEVKITSDKGGEAKFSFQSTPGSAPALQGPIATRNLAAVLASGLGGQIHIGTSVMPMKVSLDGQAAGDAGADGIDLKNVAAGDHELTLNDGKEDRKLTVTAGPAPVLTAWINASSSGGILVVNAGEDGATVLIDGKAYPRKTKRGQLWIPNLPPKDYKIKVVKQGFQDSQEQTASIKKGEEARVAFKLQAIPQIAVLHVTGGTAGADVLIDNQSVGKIDANGALSYSNVAPGDHTVEIRRDQYMPKTLTKTFRPGETLELSGDAAVLAHASGTLRLTIAPKEAQVTIKRSDDARANPILAGSHSLPAGSYTLVGKAPGYTDGTVTVQVKPGDLAVAELKLVKEGTPIKPTTAKADWVHPAEWKPDNGWLIHTGGNFVEYNVQPSTGVFVFTVRLIKGGVFTKHIQWRVNTVDDKNYVHFQLDKKSLQSRIVSNGKSVERPKIQIEGQEPFTLQIDISSDRIVHKMREGDQWVVIDTLPKANANQGKFGFFIPGKDEVAISGFSFSPR